MAAPMMMIKVRGAEAIAALKGKGAAMGAKGLGMKGGLLAGPAVGKGMVLVPIGAGAAAAPPVAFFQAVPSPMAGGMLGQVSPWIPAAAVRVEAEGARGMAAGAARGAEIEGGRAAAMGKAGGAGAKGIPVAKAAACPTAAGPVKAVAGVQAGAPAALATTPAQIAAPAAANATAQAAAPQAAAAAPKAMAAAPKLAAAAPKAMAAAAPKVAAAAPAAAKVAGAGTIWNGTGMSLGLGLGLGALGPAMLLGTLGLAATGVYIYRRNRVYEYPESY